MDRFGREMAPDFELEDAASQFPNLAQAAAHAIEVDQVYAFLAAIFSCSSALDVYWKEDGLADSVSF